MVFLAVHEFEFRGTDRLEQSVRTGFWLVNSVLNHVLTDRLCCHVHVEFLSHFFECRSCLIYGRQLLGVLIFGELLLVIAFGHRAGIRLSLSSFRSGI
ncbi:hypothetical protein C468_00845 [Halorubrum kocurii JCM 14978]|uniref:Uncharacterized protein n=1 Tax=Halorubrum kocurii JCM 14978 TaxID=1230456 RepID=M0PJF6_9EURY|nr:hypothetical protein C468_00845 [Halorubrum kocurii JCM 14978]